jgi:tetratricopeptide (TPR) repeat protein
MANEYRRRNLPLEAEHVLTLAEGLELDRDRRMAILYHLLNFELENGHFDKALAALDTIQALGFNQPEFVARRAVAYEGKGDFKKAESAYIEAANADPGHGEFVQALVRFYLDKVSDTAKGKALLQLWLRRSPSDSSAVRLLQRLP